MLFCCVLPSFALTKSVLMALFCAAIRRASVPLLRFSFRSHVQVFSCAISPVCRLKYPYSCFSSHFCFLVFVVFLSILMLPVLLAALINLSLLFLIWSLGPCIETSTQSSRLASSLPPYFLDTYHLSFLGSKVLCIVMNFGSFVWFGLV